ncbi:hypothetical protein PC120_g27248 [Phytophthora cactorum]|nr:hypothetical protein PC120_g27248 [Phytophthora cactorum]
MEETSATSSSCKVGVSAPGVDTAVICSKITEGSAARRRGDKGVSAPGVDTNSAARRRGVKIPSTPGVDDAASSVGGCKRPKHQKSLRTRVQPGCTTNGYTIKPGFIVTTESEDTLSAKTKKERFDGQSWDSLKASPFYDVLREHKDVVPDEIPAELPQDEGIQHEIDLVPGTKYCVTRQWPLPRDQVKAIDDFFESRRQAGQVRESKSPHSAPTFCVKKPQGGWRRRRYHEKM